MKRVEVEAEENGPLNIRITRIAEKLFPSFIHIAIQGICSCYFSPVWFERNSATGAGDIKQCVGERVLKDSSHNSISESESNRNF